MRKVLFSFIFVAVFSWSMAQERVTVPAEIYQIAKQTEYTRYAGAPPAMPVNTVSVMNREESEIIGRTYYDLQTNKMLQNRIHAFPDGTAGAVWTMGMTATSFPDRGTGYNYFDGSGWMAEPGERLESFRSGWPSYAPWGIGGEIVASHDFGASEIYFLTRENKGTGEWNEFVFSYTGGPPELSWPRIVTSGPENTTLHLFANTVNDYEGQVSATVYSRSLDGGITWTDENLILDGMGIDYYTEIAADEYVFAEPNGGAIAFLCASAWHDMFMMKSTDDGETWVKTVIWEHPYPFFDWEVTVTDTFFCVDNSASIALDQDGMAHVVFGINRVLHAEVGTTYSLFPYIDGIGYWNENMPSFSNNLDALAPPGLGYENSEMVEDHNYIGWTQDMNGNGVLDLVDDVMFYRELGFSTMPTISVNEEGTILVVYTSTTETYDNFDFNYKKIWARAWFNGSGWGPFYFLTQDIVYIFDESIYPVLAPKAYDGQYHLIFNADGVPGTALDGDHDYHENRTHHMLYSLPGIGVEEGDDMTDLNISLYPNPSAGSLFLELELGSAGEIEINMFDLMGRNISSQEKRAFSTGNYRVELEAPGRGTYLIVVRSAKEIWTLKAILTD